MKMTDSSDPSVHKFRPKSERAVPLQTLLDQAAGAEQEESAVVAVSPASKADPEAVPEIGGRRDGLDPTRYGDWEKDGRCIDF